MALDTLLSMANSEKFCKGKSFQGRSISGTIAQPSFQTIAPAKNRPIFGCYGGYCQALLTIYTALQKYQF